MDLTPMEQIIVAANVLAREQADKKMARGMGLPDAMRQSFVQGRGEVRKQDALKQWRNERPPMGALKPEVDGLLRIAGEPPMPPARLKPAALAAREVR